MRVLHVIPSVSPLRGGPSETVRAIVGGLARSGITVEAATTDDNGAGRLHPSASAIAVDGGIYRYFRRQTRFYTFSWPLTRWLARHVSDFDLVHIHALFSYAALPAGYWATRRNVPYIVRPLGVLNRWGMSQRRRWLKKLSFGLIEKHLLNGAAAIHYSSEQERLEAEQLGIEKKAAVIPNPVNIPFDVIDSLRGKFRAAHPELARRFIILFLSRFDAKKGLDILLPSFAALRAQWPQATLVLAGDGERAFTAHLQREAHRLGISSDVLWAGFLDRQEKWAALADVDAFVLPSYSENFAVAVVEAMAAGLPVVVSDQVGIHRDITKARAGLVVPCNGPALSRALAALMASDSLRAEMGRNAARLARTAFSTEAATENLIALYRRICQQDFNHRNAASIQRDRSLSAVS